MDANDIKMGKLTPGWENEKSQCITLCVTEACDLRCRYCYMTGKNTKNRMSYETAIKAVNFALSDEEYFKEMDSVIWDFIGGEPFLEIDLIDKLCDYIKNEMYIRKHRWFDSYRFSFSTNGLTYDTSKVQNYIQKNQKHLSIGISVDGNKLKHDAQRIRADGTGSFDDVKKVIPLWLRQFPFATTKATFAHDDLKYLKDSIIELWNMGIKEVSANVVFEDVWQNGDDKIFENQLIDLADYILKNSLWNKYSVRFFDINDGLPIIESDKFKNYCGTGTMIAIDYKGDIYPCIRYTPFTLNNADGYKIGNIETGINLDLLRPFKNLTLNSQSKDECINCDVATGCSWCSGFNYDDINGKTLFHRAIYICSMHKANVKANDYFWNKLCEKLNIENTRNSKRKEITEQNRNNGKKKFMQIITNDNIVPSCSYSTKNVVNEMSEDVFNRIIEFCHQNYFEPVILGNKHITKNENYINIGTAEGDTIAVHDDIINDYISDNNIILISQDNIINLFSMTSKLLTSKKTKRINIIIKDLEQWKNEDINIYEIQLKLIADKLFTLFQHLRPMELNVLTDIFENKTLSDCGSGINSFSVAPNGKIYICPAFYFNDKNDFIGDVYSGINIENESLLHCEKSYICSCCDAYQCKRCLFLNKKMTNEINTPPKIQCLVSHVERNISRVLELNLIKADLLEPINFINKIEYMDPLTKIYNGGKKNE